jgi:hypothetical protein
MGPGMGLTSWLAPRKIVREPLHLGEGECFGPVLEGIGATRGSMILTVSMTEPSVLVDYWRMSVEPSGPFHVDTMKEKEMNKEFLQKYSTKCQMRGNT